MSGLTEGGRRTTLTTNESHLRGWLLVAARPLVFKGSISRCLNTRGGVEAAPASHATLETRLHGRWRLITRGVWTALGIVTLAIFFASLPVYLTLLQTPCLRQTMRVLSRQPRVWKMAQKSIPKRFLAGFAPLASALFRALRHVMQAKNCTAPEGGSE